MWYGFLEIIILFHFSKVFQDFPNAASNIPMEYLFDLIPGMKPRAFSIASAHVVSVFRQDESRPSIFNIFSQGRNL